jgi:hypothetical protein
MQVPPRTPEDRAAIAQRTHHPANSALNRRAAPITRTSLLFAHPEEDKPVTVVSTQGNLLLEYQQKWLDLLGEWYEVHGEQVADEQTAFDLAI